MSDFAQLTVFRWKCLALALTTLFCPLTNAEIIGVSAGGHVWYGGVSGDLKSSSGIDLKNDLGIDSAVNTTLFISVEPPLPLIPNAKLTYNTANFEGSRVINRAIGNIRFDGPVETKLDLSNIELIVYWQLLDNLVSLDVGFGGKIYNGELQLIEVDTTVNNELKEDIDAFFPSVYGAVEVTVPGELIVARSQVTAGGLTDGNVIDAEVSLESNLGVFNFSGGYRLISTRFDKVAGVEIDSRVSGPFVSFGLVF